MAGEHTSVIAKLDDTQIMNQVTNLVNNIDKKFEELTNKVSGHLTNISSSLKKIGDESGAQSVKTDQFEKLTTAINALAEQMAKGVQVTNESANKSKEDASAKDKETESVTKTTEAYKKLSKEKQFATKLRLERILHMPTDDIDQVGQKLFQLRMIFGQLKKQDVLTELFSPSKIASIEQKIQQLQDKVNTFNQQAQQGAQKTAEATRGTIGTYDDLVRAMQHKAMRFDVSDIQAYRMQVHQLEAEIAKIERTQGPLFALQLRQELGEVNAKIREMGEGLIKAEEEEQRLLKLAEQEARVQQIASINSKRDTAKTFADFKALPQETIEQVYEKGTLLTKLLKKIQDTPLTTKAQTDAVKNEIDQISQLYLRLKQEKENASKPSTTAAATASSATAQEEQSANERIEREKKYLQEVRQNEEKIREERIKTGQQAQQEAVALRQSVMAQLSTADYSKGLNDDFKKLQQALKNMKSAYSTIGADGDSALRQSLERDIAETQKAIEAAKRYNAVVGGFGSIGTNAPTDTLIQKQADIQRLIGVYRQLSEEERNATQGQNLINSVQALSREVDIIQGKLKQPVELNIAMNLPEKSLDEIAYKMRQLQSYRETINLLDPSQRSELEAVNAKLKELAELRDKALGKGARPTSLDSVMGMSEKSLDEIASKIKMLQSFAQGVNIEADGGRYTLTQVNNEVERLNEKAKNLRSTSTQIRSQINSWNFENITKMPDDGIKNVSNKLGELKKYIKELYAQPVLDEKNIKRAENLFDRLKQKAKKYNEELGNRKNVNAALNMTANTLNEIAQKMQRLQAVRANLDVKKQKNEIEQINKALADLSRRQTEIMGKNVESVKHVNALTRSLNYMKNRLAFYFTVGASTQFVRQLIEIRGQYEMTEKALGVLIGSAERGSQVFSELSQMALVSPYTLIELSNAAKQLVAYNIAAKDVVDTTRRLADMASAVGAPVERLTYALGQIKAYGYLNSRDNRMFANMGISLVGDLSKMYSQLEGRIVSISDVYDRIKKKQVSYEDTMSVIYKMTDEGGRFFDFQAKMADTLKVQLANLTLAWNNMLNDMGADSQPLLAGSISALKELFLHWKDIEQILTELVVVIGHSYVAWKLIQLAIGKTTLATIRQTLAQKDSNAEDYKGVITKGSLTKAQAKLLISTNKSNVGLRKAIVNAEILTVKEAEAATQTTILGVKLGWLGSIGKFSLYSLITAFQGLRKGITMVGTALTTLMTNPAFLAMTFATAIMDFIFHEQRVAEATEELNKKISDGAKEATKSIEDFITAQKKLGTVSKAQSGTLTDTESVGAWEAIRAEIEKSSMASSTFVAELMKIPDLNERVARGFNYLDKIKDATNALSGLTDEIEVNSDTWLGGLFGEGLAEDLEDYNEAIKRVERIASGKDSVWDRIANFFGGAENWVSVDSKEAVSEISKLGAELGDALEKELGAEGVQDKVKVTEAIERIKTTIKSENPQIKGEAAKLFDIELDKILSQRFGEAYDAGTSMIRMIMQQVKKDSAGAFADLTDYTQNLNTLQLEAIDSAAQKIRESLPESSREAFDQVYNDMKERDWTIQLQAQFDVTELSELDKYFEDTFKPKFNVDLSDIEGVETQAEAEKWAKDWEDYMRQQFEKGEPLMSGDKVLSTDVVESIVDKIRLIKAESDRVNTTWNKFRSLQRQSNEGILEYEKRLQDEHKKTREELEKINKILASNVDKQSWLYQWAVKYKQVLGERQTNIESVQDAYQFSREKENKKSKGSQKDPLQEALKQELSLIKEMQSNYKKLRKAGVTDMEAIAVATQGYEKTIEKVNKQLKKFGIKGFVPTDFAGMNNRQLLSALEKQLQDLQKSGKAKVGSLKDLEVEIQKLKVETKAYDLSELTKGLQNELTKLKDEYSLALEFDTDVELGNAFAQLFNIDANALPHTFEDVLKRAEKEVKKYVDKYNNELSDVKISDFGDLLKTDINEWAKKNNISEDSELYKGIKAWQDYVKQAFKKTTGDAIKNWNGLIDKYGGFESKLLKITKDGAKEAASLIQRFGNDEQIKEALNLSRQIQLEPDATKVAELTKQLEELMKKVASSMPTAVPIATAITKKTKAEASKATWDDFKDSDMYAQTFEDLERVGTTAINNLLDKLEELKDKVKDSPEAMKALMDAIKKLRDESEQRNPLKGVIDSMKELVASVKEYKAARQGQSEAEERFANAQANFDRVEKDATATDEERVKASEELVEARQELETANNNVASTENKVKGNTKKLANGMQALAAQFDAAANFLTQFVDLLGLSDDSEFGAFLKDMAKGLSLVSAALGVMIAGMVLAQATSLSLQAAMGWIALAAAGLAAIVGLFSFFAGRKNRKINKEIEKSERAVKRLENAYSALERQVEKTMGNAEIHARKLAIENKRLQLAELERQLALEKSRSKKHYDEDKIIDLEGQIQDAKFELEDLSQEIIDTLLGNDIKSAAEEFVDTWVDAWREGEDTMKALEESFDEMILNMIKKSLASAIVGKQLKQLYDKVEEFTSEGSDAGVELTKSEISQLKELAENKRGIIGTINQQLKELYESLGIGFGSGKDTNLSALAQGISNITEDTAQAIEAYLNGISQQIYLHSDILIEIRDAVVAGNNRDVQMGLQAQMLLQLQNSYQVQMSIRNTLEGWSSNNGRSVRVEMVS